MYTNNIKIFKNLILSFLNVKLQPKYVFSDENQGYFVQLKKLIEDTYKANNNTPVIIVAHSMGGPMSVYFLNLQSQAWKNMYVAKLVTLSGVWGGSMKAVKVYAIGKKHYQVSKTISQPNQAQTFSLIIILSIMLCFFKKIVINFAT